MLTIEARNSQTVASNLGLRVVGIVSVDWIHTSNRLHQRAYHWLSLNGLLYRT